MTTFLIRLAIAGVIMYCFNLFVAMDGRFKNAINDIVGLVLFIYVVRFLLSYHW